MSILISGPTPNLGVFYPESDVSSGQVKVPTVGTRAKYDDGSEFVFCSTVENLGYGQVLGRAPVADFVHAAALGGASSIQVTEAGLQAGAWVGKRVSFRVGTLVMPLILEIQGNTTANSSGKAIVQFTTSLPTSLAAATAALISDECCDVSAGVAKGIFVGVVPSSIDASTLNERHYFWAQSKGLCNIRVTADTVVAGDAIFMADNGRVLSADDWTAKDIGYCISPYSNGFIVAELW